MSDVIHEDGSVSSKRPKGTHQWTKKVTYWSVKEILDENEAERTYLVDWEGIDPETNRPWDPTWEPYWCLRGSAKDAIEAWENKKMTQIFEGTREVPEPVFSTQLPGTDESVSGKMLACPATPTRSESSMDGQCRSL
jgi:hypothetical protein